MFAGAIVRVSIPSYELANWKKRGVIHICFCFFFQIVSIDQTTLDLYVTNRDTNYNHEQWVAFFKVQLFDIAFSFVWSRCFNCLLLHSITDCYFVRKSFLSLETFFSFFSLSLFFIVSFFSKFKLSQQQFLLVFRCEKNWNHSVQIVLAIRQKRVTRKKKLVQKRAERSKHPQRKSRANRQLIWWRLMVTISSALGLTAAGFISHSNVDARFDSFSETNLLGRDNWGQ